jgi:hypothetical protein
MGQFCTEIEADPSKRQHDSRLARHLRRQAVCGDQIIGLERGDRCSAEYRQHDGGSANLTLARHDPPHIATAHALDSYTIRRINEHCGQCRRHLIGACEPVLDRIIFDNQTGSILPFNEALRAHGIDIYVNRRDRLFIDLLLLYAG